MHLNYMYIHMISNWWYPNGLAVGQPCSHAPVKCQSHAWLNRLQMQIDKCEHLRVAFKISKATTSRKETFPYGPCVVYSPIFGYIWLTCMVNVTEYTIRGILVGWLFGWLLCLCVCVCFKCVEVTWTTLLFDASWRYLS